MTPESKVAQICEALARAEMKLHGQHLGKDQVVELLEAADRLRLAAMTCVENDPEGDFVRGWQEGMTGDAAYKRGLVDALNDAIPRSCSSCDQLRDQLRASRVSAAAWRERFIEAADRATADGVRAQGGTQEELREALEAGAKAKPRPWWGYKDVVGYLRSRCWDLHNDGLRMGAYTIPEKAILESCGDPAEDAIKLEAAAFGVAKPPPMDSCPACKGKRPARLSCKCCGRTGARLIIPWMADGGKPKGQLGQ
jgi:hypothetical protein